MTKQILLSLYHVVEIEIQYRKELCKMPKEIHINSLFLAIPGLKYSSERPQIKSITDPVHFSSRPQKWLTQATEKSLDTIQMIEIV